MTDRARCSFPMAALLAALAATPAHAALIDQGNYFLDTNTGWNWYTNIGDFNAQDWSTANTNVMNLAEGGLTWQLATLGELFTLNVYDVDNEILIPGLIVPTIGSAAYGWTATSGDSTTFEVGQMSFGLDNAQASVAGPLDQSVLLDFPTHPTGGAWAVSIPEPATLSLLVLGGLLLTRRRRPTVATA